MRKMKTAIICSYEYTKHHTGAGHPETPDRYSVIHNALSNAHLLTENNHITPRSATDEDILLCHSADYLELVQNEVASLQENEIVSLSTGDVNISSDSFEIAKLAIGGVLSGVDAVFSGQADNAFCLIRPPGHHACPARGMGFCLFNNVAIGARYAQKQYGISRVLIIDWDVHHGNGTQDIFEADPSVFYFSTHAFGLYPGTGFKENTGSGKGKGTILNCPILPNYTALDQILTAFDKKLSPAMKEFQPECIFISAGFDALASDPLGTLPLHAEDFSILTKRVLDIGQHYSKNRIISALEGGYDVEGIAQAAVAHVRALSE